MTYAKKWSPSEGDTVQIAQADLSESPRMEHKYGQIVKPDVGPEVIKKLQRRNRPRSLIELAFDHTAFSNGRYDICLYRDPSRNADETLHLVQFPKGVFGVYPEKSIVPAPEHVLTDPDEEDDEGSDGEESD